MPTDSFNVPKFIFVVVHEKVDIPWGHLNSRPVKVVLQGVSVLVGPVDRDSWGDEEVFERRLDIKRAALRKAEEEAAVPKKDKEAKEGDDKFKQVYLTRGGGVVLMLHEGLGKVGFRLWARKQVGTCSSKSATVDTARMHWKRCFKCIYLKLGTCDRLTGWTFPSPIFVSFGDMQKGWVEKLVQRIVDNIEINVADIHVRYALLLRTAAVVHHRQY